MNIVPFDEIVAREYSLLWAELATTGNVMGAHDMMIAATAKCHGHALLTVDGDFERVTRLDVETFPVGRSFRTIVPVRVSRMRLAKDQAFDEAWTLREFCGTEP